MTISAVHISSPNVRVLNLNLNSKSTMERRTSQLLLLLLLLSLMLLGSFPNAGVAARKLLTQEEEEEESTATVQGEAHEVAEGAPPTPSATAKTITFFLHHVVGGPNSVGGVGVGNMNGPLPLTIPAGALPGNNGVGVGVGSIGGGQFPLPLNGVATPGLGLGNNIVPGSSSSSSSFSFQNGGQSLSFPSTNVNGPLQNPLLGASGVPFPTGNGVGLKNGMEIEGPLTEGPDLHSAQIGSGKGYFFMPSSPDAAAEEGDESLLLLSFTAKFQGAGSEYEGSSVELWGKVESGKEEVEIGVVGGSGELENARGHAIIHTVSSTPLETTLEFTVNLTPY